MQDETLIEALKEARGNEQAHLEAMFKLRDVQSLRLVTLHDMITARIDRKLMGQSLFDLDVTPGRTPRIWLDLNSSIVMEPDPKTYRLVQSTESQQKILFETTTAREMVKFSLRQMAQSIVAQRSNKKMTSYLNWSQQRYSPASVVTVGLFGVLLGIFSILLWLSCFGPVHLR